MRATISRSSARTRSANLRSACSQALAYSCNDFCAPGRAVERRRLQFDAWRVRLRREDRLNANESSGELPRRMGRARRVGRERSSAGHAGPTDHGLRRVGQRRPSLSPAAINRSQHDPAREAAVEHRARTPSRVGRRDARLGEIRHSVEGGPRLIAGLCLRQDGDFDFERQVAHAGLVCRIRGGEKPRRPAASRTDRDWRTGLPQTRSRLAGGGSRKTRF